MSKIKWHSYTPEWGQTFNFQRNPDLDETFLPPDLLRMCRRHHQRATQSEYGADQQDENEDEDKGFEAAKQKQAGLKLRVLLLDTDKDTRTIRRMGQVDVPLHPLMVLAPRDTDGNLAKGSSSNGWGEGDSPEAMETMEADVAQWYSLREPTATATAAEKSATNPKRRSSMYGSSNSSTKPGSSGRSERRCGELLLRIRLSFERQQDGERLWTLQRGQSRGKSESAVVGERGSGPRALHASNRELSARLQQQMQQMQQMQQQMQQQMREAMSSSPPSGIIGTHGTPVGIPGFVSSTTHALAAPQFAPTTFTAASMAASPTPELFSAAALQQLPSHSEMLSPMP
jgi:hypothetical protein